MVLDSGDKNLLLLGELECFVTGLKVKEFLDSASSFDHGFDGGAFGEWQSWVKHKCCEAAWLALASFLGDAPFS